MAASFAADDQVDVANAKPAFDFSDPQFLSQESASSFARYCESVGAGDADFWQKIYTRLGLEYTSASPPGNLAVPPWDLSPAALKQRREPVEAMCTWHPVLRWFLFLPAGCVGCVLAILCVRYLYWFVGEGWFGENAFLVEYAVRVAEPIGFLAAALWVLPRFHRTFTVLFAVPYCTLEMLFIVMKITCSDSPWRDASLATTSLVSWVAPRYVVSVLTPATGKGSRDGHRRHCSEGDRCRNASLGAWRHTNAARDTLGWTPTHGPRLGVRVRLLCSAAVGCLWRRGFGRISGGGIRQEGLGLGAGHRRPLLQPHHPRSSDARDLGIH